MKLKIADNLTLPIEAVTQTFAILAKRGAGKSYTASVMAEEMLKANQQIVALDPTGGWFGLRSAFPIVIVGGEHGDIPLEETAGEVIAQAIVDNRFSAVVDLSLFRKGQMIRFMVQFAETMYRINRHPVHLFVDEADAFAPQGRNFGGEENRMLGAMEDIVRRGRKRGIGCTLITQRAAVLNKNVLTQCESLFAMRNVHPKDIDAIKEWISVHAEEGEADKVIESLPSLGIGEAWFWSPGWLGKLDKIKVRARETFDSSATPKPGETIKAPKTLAEINLDSLGEKIKATVERAKENDPKILRKQLAEKDRLIAELQRNKPTVEKTVEKIVEVPVLKNGQLDRTEKIGARLEEIAVKFLAETGELRRAIQPATAKVFQEVTRRVPKAVVVPLAQREPSLKISPSGIPQMVGVRDNSDADLTGPEQRILDALAWMESIGVGEPEQTAVAFLAGYTTGGGAWNNPKGKLRGRGLIEYRGDRLALTDEGRQLSNTPQGILTTEELHRRILERLPGPETKLLQVLLAAYPTPLSNEELAAQSGYAPSGGAFNNPRGRLRSLGLIEYGGGGMVRARDILFLENR